MRRKRWGALAEPVYRAMEAAVSERRLRRIAELINIDPVVDSDDGHELSLLVTEQEAYERRVYPEFGAAPTTADQPPAARCDHDLQNKGNTVYVRVLDHGGAVAECRVCGERRIGAASTTGAGT